MKSQPTPGEWVIMVSAGVMVIASFLNFVFHDTAWSSQWWPIATLSVLYGIVMGGQVALTRFGRAHTGTHVAGFSWEQLHLALGLFATLMSLGWLASGWPNKGTGLYLIAAGSGGLLVGALLLQRERHTGAF